ncbi:MAG: DsbC family protein [Castellaniella sp.]|uniref:DsbC family protein n=1 Tax=Castellaniella sp. TaxID=1955812 RepID=UPI002A36357C|nr:DsbC family protein [Castellaniella sp.]MDY0308487.1 DsbC family protein [Castellaniella sp.]
MKPSLILAALLLCGGSLSALAQPAGDRVLSTQPSAQAAPANASAPARADTADRVLSTAPVQADSAAAVTRTFEQRFPGIHVDAVRVTPMNGIFEVQVGMDLLYTDAQVDYVLQGSMIDAHARRDLTAERLESLQQVAFDSLPLDQAIKQVKGTGARKIAVFEDPNCGYCKQLHRTLEDVDDITVYTFLFPILTPDSTTRSRDIWCAADRAKAWKAWMLDGQDPAKAECDTPIQANLALGRQLNVRGTPALFFADGSRINGALPLKALEKKLNELEKPGTVPAD